MKKEEDSYSDYWTIREGHREGTDYYTRRYDKYKDILSDVPKNSKIIDIAGGAGQFLEYLRIKNATVLDISDSGLKLAKQRGYLTIKADVRHRLPIPEREYDVAYCFETLEHLYHPSKALCEINNILRDNGILFIGQPNTKVIAGHVRRIYSKELIEDLKKCGFNVEWIHYIPGFNSWDINRKTIRNADNLMIKLSMIIAYSLVLVPYSIRSFFARHFPNRFAMMYILKCKKMIK